MNTVFNLPLQGVYKFRKYLYEKGYAMPLNVKCEILEESRTQYRIKVLITMDKFFVGQKLWVRKHNVILSNKTSGVDCSGVWWHNN